MCLGVDQNLKIIENPVNFQVEEKEERKWDLSPVVQQKVSKKSLLPNPNELNFPMNHIQILKNVWMRLKSQNWNQVYKKSRKEFQEVENKKKYPKKVEYSLRSQAIPRIVEVRRVADLLKSLKIIKGNTVEEELEKDTLLPNQVLILQA